MDIELNQNLARIIRTLEGQGIKPTKIAHAIGYAATRQLDNSIEGKSMLSIKAVRGLISNLNVNPIYLFLGKGEMFLADETEVETLRRENRELIHKHSEVVKAAFALYEINKKLEKRNADLIDLSSAAIKYNQGQKQEEQAKEEKDPKDPVTENLNFLRWMSKDKKGEDNDINYLMDSNIGHKYLEWLENEIKVLTKKEPDSSVKQDKK
jgi:hypothetical protein